MTWIYWTLGTLGYLLVAVAYGSYCYAAIKSEYRGTEYDPSVAAGLMGALWPLMLPLEAFAWVVRILGERWLEGAE